jgi:taurine--2-oxoglutarate transaminase
MGKVLRSGLVDLAEKHSTVGEVRGVGLHQVIELVKNRETRQPLSPFNQPLTEPMGQVARSLREQGMMTFVRWNMIFNCPPLIINKDQIQEGLAIVDRALDEADRFYEG